MIISLEKIKRGENRKNEKWKGIGNEYGTFSALKIIKTKKPNRFITSLKKICLKEYYKFYG